MEEIERQENVLINAAHICLGYTCKGCGKTIRLFFNGGKLDEKHCCGYIYRLEHKQVDFVVLRD